MHFKHRMSVSRWEVAGLPAVLQRQQCSSSTGATWAEVCTGPEQSQPHGSHHLLPRVGGQGGSLGSAVSAPGRFWLRWGRGVRRSQGVLSTACSRGAARSRGTPLLRAGRGAAGGGGSPARRLSSANKWCRRPLPAAPVPALMNSPQPR